MSSRSKWLDWQPGEQKFRIYTESEPTKPSKPGFDGFEGAFRVDSPKIAPLPEHLADWPLSVLELLQERSAIMEFDGGLSHEEALRAAETHIRDLWTRIW